MLLLVVFVLFMLHSCFERGEQSAHLNAENCWVYFRFARLPNSKFHCVVPLLSLTRSLRSTVVYYFYLFCYGRFLDICRACFSTPSSQFHVVNACDTHRARERANERLRYRHRKSEIEKIFAYFPYIICRVNLELYSCRVCMCKQYFSYSFHQTSSQLNRAKNEANFFSLFFFKNTFYFEEQTPTTSFFIA